MNEVTSNIRAALTILDAQASRIGNDLDAEAHNLQELVENRDVETQQQIAHLSQSLSELRQSLGQIRKHLVESYTCARRQASSDEGDGNAGDSDQPEPELLSPSESDKDIDLDPAEASAIRHDEPTTLTGILRSLLMANEPAQRKNPRKPD